jgi:cold-inducible RNA-binding protein
MRIYVGNLSYDTTVEDLRQEFAAFGEVKSIDIMTDKFSGRSKGFGFVEMASISEGQAAIAALNGKSIDDRTLIVNPAKDRTEGRGGGGRSFGGNRGGGGGKSFGNKKGGGFNKGKPRRY